MRRALVARPRPWREFQVGDQVAFWRKGRGRGHAAWTCSLAWASSSSGAVSWIKERVGCVQSSIAQGVTGTVANGHNHREGSG